MSAAGPIGSDADHRPEPEARGAAARGNRVAPGNNGSAQSAEGEPATPASALERLAITREHLRAALNAHRAPQRAAAASAHPSPLFGPAHDWLTHLKSQPGVQLIFDAVHSWWAHHPLRTAGLVAAEAAKTLAQPVAQRHPLVLVFGAAIFGAILAWSRPWRWLLKPTMFAGLLPQLVSKTVSQLPLQSWISVLASLLRSNPPANDPTNAARRSD